MRVFRPPPRLGHLAVLDVYAFVALACGIRIRTIASLFCILALSISIATNAAALLVLGRFVRTRMVPRLARVSPRRIRRRPLVGALCRVRAAVADLPALAAII